MPIHLKTPDLTLTIHLIPIPYFDPNKPFENWVKCDIDSIVPGFSGANSAELQLADFRGFLSELQETY